MVVSFTLPPCGVWDWDRFRRGPRRLFDLNRGHRPLPSGPDRLRTADGDDQNAE
jgi:hypothetical protein